MLNKKNVVLLCLMALFSMGAAVFLFFIGQDALNEQHPFQFFADSNTYRKTYLGELNFDGTLISVSNNYLGPLLILEIFHDNIYFVMLFNVYIFTHSISRICSLLELDSRKVVLLLLISPITLSSLLSVNKEIFLFPFLALALNGHMRRSIFSMVLALIFSALVRWQVSVFYVLMLILISIQPHWIRSRNLVLATLLLCFSTFYVLIQTWIEPILALVAFSTENHENGGSGLYELMLGYQNQGLYFLVFPFKAFHLLFGMGFKFDKIFNPVEIYNDLFVSGHCAVSFIAFVFLIRFRQLTMRSDLIFASVIFLAFFCLTPIFAPRYLFLVFILWVLVLAGAPQVLQRQRKISRYRFINQIN